MKRKIAIMITKLHGGGAERVASNLSLYLPEEKFEKYLILFDADNIEYPYKGKVINLNTKPIKNPLGKLFNVFKRIYLVSKIKKELKIDTTLSLLAGPNLINILTRKNDRTIVSVRNFVSKSSKGFYGKVYNIIMKKLYNKSDLIVSVSEAIKDDLVENFGLNVEKITVINNPYNIEKIQKLSTEVIQKRFENIFEKPTIITAGRISDQKGHWHLIRAFKKVIEDIPDAQLVILGKGNLVEYIEGLARDLNISNNVHLLGFQKNPFKYISKSTVYAFPSLYEGFPNALCEAMACGIPVIASDCISGPREILAPGTENKELLKHIEYAEYGILVPVCDGKKYKYDDILTIEEEILAESLIDVLNNVALRDRYSKRSMIRVRDFDSEKIMKVWEEIL